MSHRRKGRRPERKPEPRSLGRAVRKHPAVTAAVALVAVVASLGIVLALAGPPPGAYVQCFDGSYTVRQHLHFWVYIQLGEREPGTLVSDFIKIPDNMGVKNTCMWPLHQHDEPGERDNYYTRIHVESPYRHDYTLNDMFYVWGKHLSYPKAVYFASDGVSFYRTADMELLVHRGPTIDPFWNVYSETARSYAYGGHVPQDGDYVEIIVHSPYETLADPY